MILLAGLAVDVSSVDVLDAAVAWPRSWLIFSEAFADNFELGCRDMDAV